MKRGLSAVIPGRCVAASPESITIAIEDTTHTERDRSLRVYGFRAHAFGVPRNDQPRGFP
jgi:hypothetical protein